MSTVSVSLPRGLRLLFLALALSAPSLVSAQQHDDPLAAGLQELESAAGGPVRVQRLPLTGLASFVAAQGGRGVPVAESAAAPPEARALSFLGRHGKLFGLRRVEDLRLVRSQPRDRLGLEHVRFQQLHDGIPVAGGELIVHLRGSLVTAANGRILPRLEGLPTTPVHGPTAALADARAVLAKHLTVTDAELSEPRLEVLDRGFIGGPRSPTRLSWFIEARKLDLRQFIWVDAIRGGVLLYFNQLTDARNRRIHTANNTAALPGSLIRSEGGPATGDSDADLAYDYSGDTYDYFFNEHGRDSYDGAGAILRSTVRYCAPGDCPYQNAFWNGSQMVYGEGFSLADDVDAHELTHAVTERSAGLFYYMQSGALNESYSDIFGETVDLTNGAGDDSPGVRWDIGEELPVLGAIRNMMDPNQFEQPARTGDPLFLCADSANDDSGGVHFNSGVPNHAYALMVDGGTFNGQTVTGIGLTKAGKIQYRALTEYLITSSDFLDNYNALQQSCQDLIGTTGISAGDCTQVTKALDAVEMADPWPCAPAQAADPAVCPIGQGPADLFVDDFENRASGKWATNVQTGFNHWNGGSGTPGIYWSGFATSGLYHLWGYDFGGTALSSVAMSKSVTLPANAKMHFRHSFGFENSGATHWDGGVLEYSTNGGGTWLDAGGLISGGAGYGGTIFAFDTNPLGGRQGFVRDSWGYTSSVLDLASLAGQSVRFRFRIGSDSCCDDYGWFIDDVRIYTCDVAGSVQFSTPVFSASEGMPSATVTVNRTGGNAGFNVDFATSNDSAIAGSDYTATSGTLSFPSFATSRTFTVPILNDLVDDDGESFDVSLSNLDGPSATMGAQQTAQVDIVDNDVAGSVQFSAANYSVGETGPVATITVARSGGSAGGASVNFLTTVGGSASAGVDYAPASGTLTFGPGVLTRTFTVPVTNDTIDEPNETINLLLNTPGGGAVLGARTTAVLTILDNDVGGVLQFSAVASSISEGAGTATIAVKRSSGLASAVSVQYATENGTAQAGADYTSASGTLSFGANETLKTFPVPILEDSLGESNETLKLKLFNPLGGATLGPASNATLTIVENESVMEFGLPNYTITETGPVAVISVKRSALVSGTTSVHYSTSNGSATAGADYTATSGDLTFGPGVTLRTFSVPITNDTTQEPPEVVLLSLSNPTGPGAALGRQATSALTVTDNDTAFRFSSATYAVNEATANAVVTVQRVNSSAGTVSVDFAATGGSATAGADFTAVSGTLTFAPGVVTRTFMVPIVNDTSAETSETVNLALSNFSPGTGPGSPSAAVLTITDNEPGLRFSSATYSVGEASPLATITVQRVGPGTGTASVDVSAANGSATANDDFMPVNTTLTFTPGVLARTFTVPIINDAAAEGGETVNLAMTNPTGAGLAAPSTAILTIADNETLFRFSAAAYTVGEASPAATITVQRLNSSAGTVSVDFAATGGSATAGADFTAVSGTLTFTPGVMSRTFTVPIANDASAEGSETVNLTLTPGAGTALGVPGAATLTITDNETLFRFTSATYTAAETTANATITVQRLNSSVGTVTVNFAATAGSATAAVDFTPVNGTLTFGPGIVTRTFAVPIANDSVDENNETVNLTLSSPSAGTNLGTPSAATLTLTDNDTAGTVRLSAATYSAGESAGVVRITLTRSGGTASTSVHYTLLDIGAQAGSDYTDNSGVVSFAAGELTKSFDVPILHDFDVEGNEPFQIDLNGPDPGTLLGVPASAVIYIVDDDV